MAWNAWKRCCKKVDSQVEHFAGYSPRFLSDPVNPESQLAIGWPEQKCQEWDEIFKRRPHISSHSRGKEKIQRQWWYLPLNKTGKNGLIKLRSDFQAAVSMKSFSPRVRRTSWASFFKYVVGQVWNGIGNELIRILNIDFILVTFGFVYSR